MDVTLWVNEMEVTKVSDLRLEERGAWTVVHAERADGSRISFHVHSEYPRAIERGRAFVAAMTAALDAVEKASNLVSIALPAPDAIPLAPDSLAEPTVLRLPEPWTPDPAA